MESSPFFSDSSDVARRVLWGEKNLSPSCSIAAVVSINLDPVTVDVAPLIHYFDPVAKWRAYPILKSIPVAQACSQAASLKLPLNVGDTGILLWFDREVYTYLLAGGITPVTPDSGDLNDLSACVFLPLLQSFPLTPSIKQSGVDITSSGVSLLEELLSAISSISTFCSTLETISSTIPPTEILTGALYAAPVAAAATTLGSALSDVSASLVTFVGEQI